MRRFIALSLLALALLSCEGSAEVIPSGANDTRADDIEVRGTPADTREVDTEQPEDTVAEDTTQPDDLDDASDADMHQGATGSLQPYWIIQDRLGETVPGLHSGPIAGASLTVDIATHNGSCVAVTDLDGTPTHGAQYSLTTGAMADCMEDEALEATYNDLACTVLIAPAEPRVTLHLIDGEVYGGWGDGPDYVDVSQVYQRNSAGTCYTVSVSAPNAYRRLRQLPASFPLELPGSAPFEMRVIYP